MRKSYLFIIISVFWGGITTAQIPKDYYNSVSGISGAQLKETLHKIIKGHVEFPYSSSSTDTWDILKEADSDTTNAQNVILFYSGWSVNAAQEYNNAKGWSREHTWAKSHGDFGTSKGAGTDLHHLKPCDISVNSARGNDDFDNGGAPYVDGDGETQCNSDYDSWEARDDKKGDVARMLFYMAVRYEGSDGEPDLELVDRVNTSSLNESGKGYHGKLSTLLKWHKLDPVDHFEQNRNNVIFSYQKNRNPFIDHPEYVERIWNITTAIASVKQPAFKIYPNPATNYLKIECPDNNFAKGTIFSTRGEALMAFEGKNQLSLQNFEPGLYIIRLITDAGIVNSKLIIQ